MEKSVSVITNALFEKLPHNLPFYTQDSLVQYGLPPFLVKRISQTVYLRILEKISLPDETWLNHESDIVTEAWDDLTGAIKQELRIPSGIMKEVLEKSVRHCLELSVQPRRAIGKHLFGDDHELDAATITERASSITVNRYLVWSLIRYMEKKKKDKIDREQAIRILEKIDNKVVENYHPLNWLALVKPLFELCGPTVPTNLLRLFFEDKKQNPAAKEFDLLAKEINETQFIEVLSSPDLLYVEGFNDDQQTLFKESLEDDLEDPLNQKFMKSTEDLPEILPVDDETDIRDDIITEADGKSAEEVESTVPWDEDPREAGTATPEEELEDETLASSFMFDEDTEPEPEDDSELEVDLKARADDDNLDQKEDLLESPESDQKEIEGGSEPESVGKIQVGDEFDDYMDQEEDLLESSELEQEEIEAESEPDQNDVEAEFEPDQDDLEIEPEPEADLKAGADDDSLDHDEELLESTEPDQDDVEEQEELKAEKITDREQGVDTDAEPDSIEVDSPKKEVTIEAIEISDDEDDFDSGRAEGVDLGSETAEDTAPQGAGKASAEIENESLASRFMFDEGTESEPEPEEDQDLDEATTIYDELNLARKGDELSTLDLFSNPDKVTFEKKEWISFDPDESEPDDIDPGDTDSDDSETYDTEPDESELNKSEPDEPETDELSDSEKYTESESPLFVDESEFKTMNEGNPEEEGDELPMWRSFLEREDVDNTSSFQFDHSGYDLTEKYEDDDEEVTRETGTALTEDEEHVEEADVDVSDDLIADEDSELLDEDGFIEEPIYDLTKEEIPIDQKIGDLNEWMLDEKETFIEEIFGDSEDAYEQALADIIEYTDWKSASRYIEKEIFTRNRIDVYDEIAVDFTDRLHSYFLEKK